MDLETENKSNEKVEVNKGCPAFLEEIGKFLFWVVNWVILWKCSFCVYFLHFSAMKYLSICHIVRHSTEANR